MHVFEAIVELVVMMQRMCGKGPSVEIQVERVVPGNPRTISAIVVTPPSASTLRVEVSYTHNSCSWR